MHSQNPLTIKDKGFKIFSDGEALYGITGGLEAGHAFIRWILQEKLHPEKFPKIEPGVLEAISVPSEDYVETWTSSYEPFILRPDGGLSWGSGTAVALGALSAGVNALKAMDVACEHDPFSKYPMQVLTYPHNCEERAEEPYILTYDFVKANERFLFNPKLTAEKLYKFLEKYL